MGSTAKMKAGLSQAPGAHQEVLFCSAQTSDSCEAEEQHQKDRFSSVRQGCCGWIQGEPRQAVQPHQPHQDSGCRGLRRCEVLPWQKDHVHVPCKDREGRKPIPCHVGESVPCSWHQWHCACQIHKELASIRTRCTCACYAFPQPCLIPGIQSASCITYKRINHLSV